MVHHQFCQDGILETDTYPANHLVVVIVNGHGKVIELAEFLGFEDRDIRRKIVDVFDCSVVRVTGLVVIKGHPGRILHQAIGDIRVFTDSLLADFIDAGDFIEGKPQVNDGFDLVLDCLGKGFSALQNAITVASAKAVDVDTRIHRNRKNQGEQAEYQNASFE